MDESFSVTLSQNADISHIIDLANKDIHPPLYYLVLHFFILLPGQIEILARVPSVIFGTLALIPIYFLAKVLFDRKVAIATALLYAVSFVSITYSQEARMYPMVLFLGAIQIYYFYRAMKENRLLYWAIFVITSVLIVYTHYYGIILTGSLFAYGIVASFRHASWKMLHEPMFRNLLICLAIISLAFLPQLPVAYQQSQSSGANSELHPNNLMFYPRLAYFLAICGIKNPKTFLMVALMGIFAALAVAGILIDRRKKPGELSYLLAILILSSLSCLILSNEVRFCGYRYVIFLLIPYLVLVANGTVSIAGLLSGKNKNLSAISIMAMLALILVIEACSIAPLYNGSNVDLRGAIQYVRDHSSPDDQMAIMNSDNISSVFYARLLGMESRTIENPGYDDIKKSNNSIRWVVISDDTDWPANKEIRPWLNEHMKLYAAMTRVSVYGGDAP